MKQELVLKEKLPDGWELVQVRDILTMEYGSSLPHTVRMMGNIPVYGSNGIIGYHNLSLIDFPTVIVGRKGSAGEVNFVNVPCFPIDTTYYIKSTHNIKFIYYLLKGLNLGKIRQRGVKQGLNRDDVYSLKTIFSYDPKIQKAFVAKLDSQMTQIEIMKKEAEKEKGASEAMKSSYIEQIFSQPYQEVKLDELISFIRSGLSREFSPTNVGVPVMRSTNIILNDSKIDLTEIRYWYWNDPQGADVKKYLLDQGDILLNFINSPAQIGKVCIYISDFKDCIYTTNSFRIKFNQDKLLHPFFRIFSLTTYYRRQIEATTKKAVNQASFTQRDLKEIKIKLPGISEQKKIVEEFEKIEIEADVIQKFISHKLSAISLLPSALLNEVFGKYDMPEVK